jgi:hypothetical protein
MAMEAALQDRSQSEFMTAPAPFSREALDKFKILLDTGQTGYADLRNLARRLLKEDPNRRLNYKLLADALRIHPSTLYRRYGMKHVRSAIKGAKKSLKQWEAELKEAKAHGDLTDAEKDELEIHAKFDDIQVDKDTPSPYIPQVEPHENEA